MKLKEIGLSLLTITFVFFCRPAWSDIVHWQPGTGLASMSYDMYCNLGQVLLEVQHDGSESGDIKSLKFRQRSQLGGWSATETITTSFAGDSVISSGDAALFYVNRGGTANWEAYYLLPGFFSSDPSKLQRYTRNSNGTWTQTHSNLLAAEGGEYNTPALFTAAMTSDGVIHFAVLDDSMKLRYFRFDGVDIIVENADSFINRTAMDGFDSPHQRRPRNLSMAVSNGNVPHIVYSVDQVITPVSGGTRLTSKLFYISKPNNSWVKKTIINPGSNPHDAGLGASIAIAPNGVVAVASTYLPRAGTGSPGVAELRYLTKNSNGSWSSTVISKTADGYLSRDGHRGTGLYPHLQFDNGGSPHVVFTDHASEHAGTAWSYSGQLRYATRASANQGSWKLQTLVKQPTADAWLRRLDRPVIATSPKSCRKQIAIYAVSQETSEHPLKYEYKAYFRRFDLSPPIPPILPWTGPLPWAYILLLLDS